MCRDHKPTTDIPQATEILYLRKTIQKIATEALEIKKKFRKRVDLKM